VRRPGWESASHREPPQRSASRGLV
jgi:hypothetical protein